MQGLNATVTSPGAASSPRSPSPARRRCRRTSSCRGSCSAPRSPTCRRRKRCSSPPPSPRSSRAAAASIRSTRCESGWPRPPAHRPGRRRHRPAHRDRRRQIHHPQIVRRSRDRRRGLFGNPGRISGHPLAVGAVDGDHHRPLERERAGVRRTISQQEIRHWRMSAFARTRFSEHGNRAAANLVMRFAALPSKNAAPFGAALTLVTSIDYAKVALAPRRRSAPPIIPNPIIIIAQVAGSGTAEAEAGERCGPETRSWETRIRTAVVQGVELIGHAGQRLSPMVRNDCQW